jgi:hypothetical protein
MRAMKTDCSEQRKLFYYNFVIYEGGLDGSFRLCPQGCSQPPLPSDAR